MNAADRAVALAAAKAKYEKAKAEIVEMFDESRRVMAGERMLDLAEEMVAAENAMNELNHAASRNVIETPMTKMDGGRFVGSMGDIAWQVYESLGVTIDDKAGMADFNIALVYVGDLDNKRHCSLVLMQNEKVVYTDVFDISAVDGEDA